MNRNNKPVELKPLFLERMKKLLPDEKDFEKFLEEIKIQPVNAIRCNKLKISSDKLKKTLEEKYNWKISIPWKAHPEIMVIEGKFDNNQVSDNLVNNQTMGGWRGSGAPVGGADLIELEPGELGRSLEHLLGYYYIQELSSMLPVIALAPEKNQRVLDLCAAPGSKTTQISSEMQNTGIIIANEPSLPRLKILSSNLERCGASNVIITKKDGRDLCRRMVEMNFKFSKILIDAPCSGEGTLKSSQKTALMWNIKTIENLPAIQFSLFRAAFEVLETGGEIIYSTCTHAPEENEGVVDKILREFEGRIEISKPNLPKELKTREGVTSWDNSVAEKKGEEGNNLDDNDLNCSQQKGQWGRGKENSNKKIGGKGEQFSEKSKIKNYDKQVKLCARVYPQDNKTEGFFVAKFRRIK